MANIDLYLQGTDEQNFAPGALEPGVYRGVVDLAKVGAVSGIADGDVVRLVEFEAGTFFQFFDAEITATLTNHTNIDMGNTISSATDPDDYINAQTTTAVGVFGSVEAGAIVSGLLASDGYIALSFVASTPADMTGKIAWMVKLTKPTKLNKERGEKRTYTN